MHIIARWHDEQRGDSVSNYQSALKRINNALSRDGLKRVWDGLVRVHGVGHLSDYDLTCLDYKMIIKCKCEKWEIIK